MAQEDHEFRLTKLEVWKDGNGTAGADTRISALEERVKPENCIGCMAIKEYFEEQKAALAEQKAANEKRRTFRIADIANIIQLVVLLTVVYKLFIG